MRNPEHIKTGDALIANYMGYDLHKGLFIHREAETPIGNTIPETDLMYHASWDWLMPVWVKILQWGYSEYGISWEQDIDPEFAYIRFPDAKMIWKHTTAHKTTEEDMRDAVWYVVVEFINWYNTQDKKESL